MLRGQGGRQWKGTYDLHFNHHDSAGHLRKAAAMNCGICRVIYDELQAKLGPAGIPDKTKLSITAGLSLMDPGNHQLYRLDFKLRYDRVRIQRTFVLKQTSEYSSCRSFVIIADKSFLRQILAIQRFSHQYRITLRPMKYSRQQWYGSQSAIAQKNRHCGIQDD
jgi:hypothetical protein